MVLRLIAALACSLVLPASALAAPCAGFLDVDDTAPATAPFCESVEWMKNRAITLGCTDNLYCPNQNVTRLQMAAFMNRLGKVVFQQGGNAYGATAVLGTTDVQAVEVHAAGRRGVRYEPAGTGLNVIAGTDNGVSPGVFGAAIAGGSSNSVTDNHSTVSGGELNTAGAVTNGSHSTVAGGRQNTAGGAGSMVPGGYNNQAHGQASFAAGLLANAAHSGCFVWADVRAFSSTSCFAPNEFVARASGGFYFWTAGIDDTTYSGARLAPGTGAWAAYSDRDGKHEIEPVDGFVILDKLAALPLSTWQWKAEPGAVKHLGPMAQDFHAAFGLGSRDTEIVSIDADGVALAAIQALNVKLEAERAARQADIAVLKSELAELRARITGGRP